MLDSERYPDDGNAQDKAEHRVNDRNLPPAAKDPYHIENGGQAALAVCIFDMLSEWPESEHTELEQLESERNADDGDAHYETCNEIHH